MKNVFVLKGGLGGKQRREIAEQLAAVSENEQGVIIATAGHIGWGFDEARLDTLFLAMPISWKGTLQQYVSRRPSCIANEAGLCRGCLLTLVWRYPLMKRLNRTALQCPGRTWERALFCHQPLSMYRVPVDIRYRFKHSFRNCSYTFSA